MGTFWVVVVVLVVLGSLILTALGFRPARPHHEFRADRSGGTRFFANAPEQVASAYSQAATRTPGVKLAPGAPGELYLDCRPTARILSGDFGTVIRLRFLPQEQGTQVVVEAQAKMWGPTKVSTLRELERALRMRAMGLGITEVMDS